MLLLQISLLLLHLYSPTLHKNNSSSIVPSSCYFTFSSFLNMSFTSCNILLFLLCLSLHACHARYLGSVDKKLETKFHFTSKNDEKKGFNKNAVLPKVQVAALSKELGSTNEESIAKRHTDFDTQKLEDVVKVNQKALKNKKFETLGAVQNESVVSVSWSVPHRKRGEKNPDFNLDYSPPKTHPPSHN